jgi:hypothetical protein
VARPLRAAPLSGGHIMAPCVYAAIAASLGLETKKPARLAPSGLGISARRA